MLANVVGMYLPSDWSSTSRYSGYGYSSEDYQLVDIPAHTSEYTRQASKVQGSFNAGTSRVVRVENPFLYAQFLLKKEEYQTRGHTMVQELLHDTAASNIASIASGNLDWRRANRVKFGRGVSFSPSCSYANQQSSRSNGSDRAMIVADVLVRSSECVSGSQVLPSGSCDTTIGNNSNVYVKYYDNEFYPKYVVYYTSRTQARRGGLRFYW